MTKSKYIIIGVGCCSLPEGNYMSVECLFGPQEICVCGKTTHYWRKFKLIETKEELAKLVQFTISIINEKLSYLDSITKSTPPKGITKEREMKNSLIGKKVIVRSNVAGAHAGVVKAFYPSKSTITLTGAYRLWRYYTRDKSGSVSDVAANGLKPNGGHSIGARLASVTIVNPNGLEISEMTNEAYASVENWKS